MQYNTDHINHLIRNRRSVFPDQFETGKLVPDEVVREILINATWAPTHGHTEPWRFPVITGEGLKKLATFQSELYKQEAGAAFSEKKYLKLQQQPLKASHIIAIGMKRTANSRIPEVEEMAAVACAVQNIYLTVTAYGLGGYWTTGGITYMDRAKSFFGLDAADRLMGFFYLGYVAVPSGKGKRMDISAKTSWIR
ncbi:MAG: nitroreductase [Chitinophagaceae bacterium]|nr:nitroreductase [Chitinophagaceae bacterium]